MVLLYRLSGSGPRGEVRTLVFASGYLLVWGAVGLAAYAVAAASAAVTPGSRSVVAAAVLVLAGVYQFTPLKGACLRACRTPADFLMQHWRGGTGGALRLGFHHGAYCLGCCWALMLVLVVAGSMGLGWVVFTPGVGAWEFDRYRAAKARWYAGFRELCPSDNSIYFVLGLR